MSENEALQRMKKVRAGHRTSATRTQGQVSATLGEASPDLDTLPMLKLTPEEKLKELDADIVNFVAENSLETKLMSARRKSLKLLCE